MRLATVPLSHSHLPNWASRAPHEWMVEATGSENTRKHTDALNEGPTRPLQHLTTALISSHNMSPCPPTVALIPTYRLVPVISGGLFRVPVASRARTSAQKSAAPLSYVLTKGHLLALLPCPNVSLTPSPPHRCNQMKLGKIDESESLSSKWLFFCFSGLLLIHECHGLQQSDKWFNVTH